MLEEIFRQLLYMLIFTIYAGLLLFAPLMIIMLPGLWVTSKYFRIEWSELAPSNYERRVIYIGIAASCLTWSFFIVKEILGKF